MHEQSWRGTIIGQSYLLNMRPAVVCQELCADCLLHIRLSNLHLQFLFTCSRFDSRQRQFAGRRCPHLLYRQAAERPQRTWQRFRTHRVMFRDARGVDKPRRLVLTGIRHGRCPESCLLVLRTVDSLALTFGRQQCVLPLHQFKSRANFSVQLWV